MKKKKEINKFNERIKEELKSNAEEITKDLKKVYKFVYVCSKCGLKYGSDKEEKGKHLCPICERM